MFQLSRTMRRGYFHKDQLATLRKIDLVINATSQKNKNKIRPDMEREKKHKQYQEKNKTKL